MKTECKLLIDMYLINRAAGRPTLRGSGEASHSVTFSLRAFDYREAVRGSRGM